MKKIFVSLVVLSLFSVAHAEDRYNAAPVDNTYVAPPVTLKGLNWGKVSDNVKQRKLGVNIAGSMEECTPPTKSDYWPNEILTSGRYAKIDPAFEKGMITIFRKEGECNEIEGDAGGYTCFGVSSKAHPDVDFDNFTRADAEDIAWNRYYKKYNLDRLPANVRADVLYDAWGSGRPRDAIKRLQRVLGVELTGIVDATTIKAAVNYKSDLHNDFLDVLWQRYQNIGQYLKARREVIKLYRENGCKVPAVSPLKRG